MSIENETVEVISAKLKEFKSKLDATLAEERKAHEDLVKAKADGEAVSEQKEKLVKLEAAFDSFQKDFDKEVVELKKASVQNSGSDEAQEVKASFFETLRAGNANRLDDAKKTRLANSLFDYAKKTGMAGGSLSSAEQVKSMISGNDLSAGILVLPSFLETSIYHFMEENNALYGLAAKTSIDRDSYTRDGRTSEAGALWAGETDTWNKTNTPEYGEIKIDVHKIFARPTISQDLIEDARINMEAEVMDFTREAFNKKIAHALVLGTGGLMPLGFLNEETIKEAKIVDTWKKIGFVASGAASAFAEAAPADAFIDLQEKLKTGYRGRASWVMNHTVATAVRKFKDTEGRYLWETSFKEGVPGRLLGSPVRYDENMPNVAAGAFPIAYGDFTSALLVVNRRGIRVVRDLVTNPGQVTFNIDMRLGMGVRYFEAIKLMKIAAN